MMHFDFKVNIAFKANPRSHVAAVASSMNTDQYYYKYYF